MAPPSTIGNRPRPLTILAAAFLAGGAAAVGLNHFLDVYLSQRKPVVESEPIFIAMRSLPSGAPVTVWDVALRNWPKAMLPTTAMRVEDSFEGMYLKMPLREGQPLLSVQLEPAAATTVAAAAAGGSSDDGMIVVDDRTKIQMSWPAPRVNDSAAAQRVQPAEASGEREAIPPLDDRLAIRPMKPVPRRTEPAPTAASPRPAETTASDTPSVGAPIAEPAAETPAQVAAAAPAATDAVSQQREPDPREPGVPTVVESPPVAVAEPDPLPLPAADAAVAVAPPREQLPEVKIPRDAPELTLAPQVAQKDETTAEPQLRSVVVTAEPLSTAAMARPIRPAPSPVVTSQRHLVVPERIAVMVDEVTTGAQQPESSADKAATANSQRTLPPPQAATSAVPAARRSDLNLGQPQQPAGGVRMPEIGVNPLRTSSARMPATRSQAQRPATARPLTASSTPAVATPPQSQAVRRGPAVQLPQTNSEVVDDTEAESRMFPRVSARLEKAGEDWSRFRQSIFGSSQDVEE